MITSINKEIDEKILDTVVTDLEQRPEMVCSGNLCGGYSGVCGGVLSSSGVGVQFW